MQFTRNKLHDVAHAFGQCFATNQIVIIMKSIDAKRYENAVSKPSVIARMSPRVVLVSAVILMQFWLILAASPFKRFKSVECSSSNKTIAPDYKCFLTPVSHKNTTLTFIVNITQPIYQAKVSLLVNWVMIADTNTTFCSRFESSICMNICAGTNHER